MEAGGTVGSPQKPRRKSERGRDVYEQGLLGLVGLAGLCTGWGGGGPEPKAALGSGRIHVSLNRAPSPTRSPPSDMNPLQFVFMLDLCCCAWTLSSYGEQGLLFDATHGFRISGASLVVENRL